MTNPQTEARMILAGRRLAFDNESGPQALIDAIATALAAKNAELEKVKAELVRSRDFWSEEFSRELKAKQAAEADLAKAREALEPFAAYIVARDENDSDLVDDDVAVATYATAAVRGPIVRVTFGHLRAARRALTGGQDG